VADAAENLNLQHAENVSKLRAILLESVAQHRAILERKTNHNHLQVVVSETRLPAQLGCRHGESWLTKKLTDPRRAERSSGKETMEKPTEQRADERGADSVQRMVSEPSNFLLA